MLTAALIKENVELGLAGWFRGLVHYSCGGKHGGTQADLVLEKELRVLHTYQQAAGKEKDIWSELSIFKS